jgi:hypothetical protein
MLKMRKLLAAASAAWSIEAANSKAVGSWRAIRRLAIVSAAGSDTFTALPAVRVIVMMKPFSFLFGANPRAKPISLSTINPPLYLEISPTSHTMTTVIATA